jgi:hypothetical protein
MAWYDAIVIGVGLVGALADLVVEPTGDAQSVAAAPILPLTQASLSACGGGNGRGLPPGRAALKEAERMTDPHPLTSLVAPRSVAIFGASNDPERISGRPLRYFLEARYSGALFPINPNRDTVQGMPAYPDLAPVPDRSTSP